MEVEIISQEIIKPSLPTPDHLKIFKRSFIDQITGGYLVRFISFYRRKESKLKINEVTNQLKTSLSQTLTRYYPLAGIYKDDSTIECNDKGALFVTAHVHCNMNELINQPKFQQFHKLGTSSRFHGDGSFQVSVQFNTFSSGGVAIFMCFYHMIMDITTISVFLKCWAAMASGSQDHKSAFYYPEYKSAVLFPVKDSVPFGFSVIIKSLSLNEGRSTRKRFVFSSAAISDLKVKGFSDPVPDPTSVEVVSSFIWKHAMAAAKAVQGVQEPSVLVHAADMRRRMVPPLPEYSAGNIISMIIAEYDGIDECEVKFGRLVELLRVAKEENKNEFVPKIQSSKGYDVMMKSLEEWGKKCSRKGLNTYQFTCWCKMGLNQVDFGWGKPVWTSLVGGTEVESMYKNFVVLLDGSDGGIEAWLILEQQETAILESDQDFLAYASLNPGIIS
ncbi:vinorine synthase-like [Coffea eugenioides]|uniref:vinorine synthase-like n=1 Tax=Coffea eugenioides TaxID=49369 RepID=UPI000F60501E|nr:vinorine synthase-like [Coffea eugenioides]